MNTAAGIGKTAASTGSAGFDLRSPPRKRGPSCWLWIPACAGISEGCVGAYDRSPQRDGEPHERRCDFPRRAQARDEISRDFRDAAAPAAVIDRDFADA